jgi:20S proteasome subunit beta 4
MDCVFGIQGKDYILLAGDKAAVGNSIIKFQDSDSKLLKLADNQVIACVGESFDKKNFPKYVKANTEAYYFENGQRLTTDETASYIRNLLAKGIRSSPHQCNCLLAGFDTDGPKLYWLDYLGSYVKLLKAAHGYGAYFLYGLMDNFYKKDMSLADGEMVIKNCIKELKTRFAINMVNFDVFKITKNGIEDISNKFNNALN